MGGYRRSGGGNYGNASANGGRAAGEGKDCRSLWAFEWNGNPTFVAKRYPTVEVRMTEYVALIHHDEGGDYGVSFPDFPGCVASGATLDEARALAAEALALHMASMAKDGETIPPPSPLAGIMAEWENLAAKWLIVV
jgi:predicted RNase H-like HicB family nuclease